MKILQYLLYCIIGLLLAGSIHAQPKEQTNLPFFFNAQERLTKPNVSAVHRLRFVTTVDFAPFNFINSSGYLAGYHIDLVRAICSELQLETKCEIEALPFDELIPHIEENGAEAIIAGLAATNATRDVLDFTAAYFRFPARFMALKGQNLATPLSKAEKGQSIGVLKNTAHQQLLSAYFPTVKAITFDNEAALYEALQDKTVSAIFGDGMRFSLWVNDQKDQCCELIDGPYMAPQFLGEGLRIAALRGKEDLIDMLDYALKSLERKGKLKELYLRYFPIGFY